MSTIAEMTTQIAGGLEQPICPEVAKTIGDAVKGVARDTELNFEDFFEAMGGGAQAREGMGRLMALYGSVGERWASVRDVYREQLYFRGRSTDSRKGFDSSVVEEVLAAGGKLTSYEFLRCRVRYFTDGMALGTEEYLADLFAKKRHLFGPFRLVIDSTGCRRSAWLCGDFS